MSAFGAFLADKMHVRGWSGVRLEEKSGVPDANISRWINKGGRPSPEHVTALAQAFEEEVADWMRIAGYPVGDPSDPSEEEKLLLTYVRSFPWLQALVPDILELSGENQRVVRQLVKSMLDQEGDDTAQSRGKSV